jgi:hypothetical protein
VKHRSVYIVGFKMAVHIIIYPGISRIVIAFGDRSFGTIRHHKVGLRD